MAESITNLFLYSLAYSLFFMILLLIVLGILTMVLGIIADVMKFLCYVFYSGIFIIFFLTEIFDRMNVWLDKHNQSFNHKPFVKSR